MTHVDYQREWRKQNSNRLKEYSKKYNNSKNGKLKRKAYQETDGYKQSIQKAQQKYLLNNPEKRKESQKKYKEKAYTNKQIKARILRDSARQRAKKYNYAFNLEVSDIIIPDICPALGIPLLLSRNSAKDNRPTLDRIDNQKGYIKGNIAVISHRANRIKSDASTDELFKLAYYSVKTGDDI